MGTCPRRESQFGRFGMRTLSRYLVDRVKRACNGQGTIAAIVANRDWQYPSG